MHFHKWTKWEVIQKGDVLSSRTGKTTGAYLIQQRNCEVCGKTQIEQEDSR